MPKKYKPKLSLTIPTTTSTIENAPPLRPNLPSSTTSPTSTTTNDVATLQLLNPNDIERYEVIGHGSFSTVYRALYRVTNTVVAMKVIKREVTRDARQQLAAELRALRRAAADEADSGCEGGADSLVGVVDAFYTDGSVSVLLEFMPRGSLRHVLRRAPRRRLPNEHAAAFLAASVVRGLHYLHKKLHVLHRDIKPANLLFDDAGRCKIADFGVSGQLESTMAQAHSWVGTIAYMSPERVKDKPYTAKADIWSFGLTLAEACLGCYPFFYVETSDPKTIKTNNNNDDDNNNSNDKADAAPPLRPSSNANNAPPMRPVAPSSEGSTPTGKASSGRELGAASFWQLLQLIDTRQPPRLPAPYTDDCNAFVQHCLQRDDAQRYTAEQLLQHRWLTQPRDYAAAEMRAWLCSLAAPDQ